MSTPKEMKSAEEHQHNPGYIKEHRKIVGWQCDCEECNRFRAIQADVLEWCIQECQKQFIGVPKTICEKHAELTKGKE